MPGHDDRDTTRTTPAGDGLCRITFLTKHKLSAVGRASAPERRRLGKAHDHGRRARRWTHQGAHDADAAPGTGRDRCLTIRGRRERRKTRKILDNDPAGCYIRGQRRGHPCVRRAPSPQQCVADGETVQRWGALPVRPLPETSPRHAPCPLPPRSGGPLRRPAPPVSPRPAALGHRPRRARGWPPAPRRLGDPPRGPAGLDPAGAGPAVVAPAVPAEGAGGPGIASGPREGPPLLLASGVPLPHACDTRPPWQAPCPSGTGLAAASPTLRWPRWRLPTCRGRWPWPGRSPARWRGRGRPPTHAPPAARAGDPSCPARGRGVLRDLVLSRGPCWTPPTTGSGPPDRGPEAPRAAAGGPPAARAACPPQGLAATYSPPSLGEPERLLVSPPEPAPLLLGP